MTVTMAETPVVQILDKQHAFTQAIVPLPNELPLAPLGPSSLRVRTQVFSLTSNNFTYAKLGSLLGWWNFHPLPPSTPAPYNNTAKYGRTNCWGYALVLDSTFASVPAGSHVFGYLPIGTLPLDLQVTPGRTPGRIIENSPHRTKLMPLYNEYDVHLPSTNMARSINNRDDTLGLDCLLGVMHGLGYLLNNHIFPQSPSLLVHPSPDPTSSPWTYPAQADLTNTTILSFAPGSKTAIVFAHLLKYQRPLAKPRQVVGITSEASRPFVVTTNLYDSVALTGENPRQVISHRLGLVSPATDKILVIDFGGRAGAAPSWVSALKTAGYDNVTYLGIGRGIEEAGDDPSKFMQEVKAMAALGCVRANTDDAKRRAIEVVGDEHKYIADVAKSWDAVRDKGIPGFSVKWGTGMDSVRDGWDALAKGDVLPEAGLAFKI